MYKGSNEKFLILNIIDYSLFILFWIAIIYDFFSKPKNEDDQQWEDFSFLRKCFQSVIFTFHNVELYNGIIGILKSQNHVLETL